MGKTLLLALATATLIAATSIVSAGDVEPSGDTRDRLTFDEMMAEAPNEDGPIHNGWFMPVGDARPAHHELSGVLDFQSTAFVEDSGQSADMYGIYFTRDGHPIAPERFPEFSATFLTSNGYLIPVERDIIRTTRSDWDIILSPGRVWSEPGDNGWSRASFPFVLVGRKWNDSHNGIATFLYNDTEVSDLQFQIVQELASWWRFNAWARVPLNYRPGSIANHAGIAAAFTAEQAQRLSTAPLTALHAETDLIDGMERGLKNITVTGLVSDGVLYRSPCYTRYGDFPYCDDMRHGVYALTTSTGAVLSLLWLAQRYGAHVLDLRIADYVDVTARHDGWNQVTFRDAINMATGIGDEAYVQMTRAYVFEADLDAAYMDAFYDAADARTRLDVALRAGNYVWDPGEAARYNHTHAFVLAAAMDAYLKSKEGPDTHLWDMVTGEVLQPLGIHHAPMTHTREPDGGRGLPLFYEGYFPTVQDLAKIAQLYHDRGVFDGRQLIYADELYVLLAGDPRRGLPIKWFTDHGEYTYEFSFWYMPYTAAAGCWVRIPEMLWAGNLVTLMPNGMTGIRLADAPEGSPGKHDGENMAALADGVRSFCE